MTYKVPREQQTNMRKTKLERTKDALKLAHITTINHKSKQNSQTKYDRNPKPTHELK